MPDRKVARELSDIFKVVAHPDRIRIIEVLRGDEKDVNTLVDLLGLSGSRVSQHLSLMRAHRIVDERPDGRHRYYHLTQPELADWIVEGLAFVEGRLNAVSKATISEARKLWSVPTDKQAVP